MGSGSTEPQGRRAEQALDVLMEAIKKSGHEGH